MNTEEKIYPKLLKMAVIMVFGFAIISIIPAIFLPMKNIVKEKN